MPPLVILRQPRALQPKNGFFAHKPELAWYVKGLAEDNRYAGFQDEDVTLESLEFFGKEAWSILRESTLFDVSRLEAFKSKAISVHGINSFYPVARLRSSAARPLSISLTYSGEELAYLNNQLLQDLSANRFKLSRQSRNHLGSGDIPDFHHEGAAAIELLELELSDGSLLLGWGWVWYHA